MDDATKINGTAVGTNCDPRRPEGACADCWTNHVAILRRAASGEFSRCSKAMATRTLDALWALDAGGTPGSREREMATRDGEALCEAKDQVAALKAKVDRAEADRQREHDRSAIYCRLLHDAGRETNDLKADRERDAVEIRRLNDLVAELRRNGAPPATLAGGWIVDDGGGGCDAPASTPSAVRLVDLASLAEQADDAGEAELASDLYGVIHEQAFRLIRGDDL